MSKIKCPECGWIGTSEERLVGINPFDPTEEVHGCPKCKEINDAEELCDEFNCDKPATCGTPSPRGYRRTCWEHAPKGEAK